MAIDNRQLFQAASAVPNLMSALQQGIQAGTAIRQAPILAELQKESLRQQKLKTEALQQAQGAQSQQRFIGTPQRITRNGQDFLVGLTQGPTGIQLSETPVQGEFISSLGETAQEQTQRKIEETGGVEESRLGAQLKIKPNIAKQEALAKDAAKLSTEIFSRVDGIGDNIRNMEEGIRLIDEGAATGPISKWLPSFRDSTVQLDNIKNRLGLDVIGSVTFGALSASELKTAFDTAVPSNLRGKALKEWFGKRIDAQRKLMNSLEEAGIFLAEDGASIPKLMAKKRQERKSSQQAPSQGFKILSIE